MKKIAMFIIVICGVSVSYSQNNYIQFDGSDDYIKIITEPDLPLDNSSRTVSAWIKDNGSSNNWGSILHWGNGDCNGKMWGLGKQGGKLVFWGGCQDWKTNLIIPQNEWVFISLTYDSLSFKARVNNKKDSTIYSRAFETKTGNFFIGGETVDNGSSFRSFFKGYIDEVSVWDTILNDQEIDKIYNGNTHQPNLVGYWDFNKGADSTVYDSSPNSNDGTLFGATRVLNSLPTDFEWISNASDTIVIDSTNLNSTYTLQWGTSVDTTDGDSINYSIYAKIGVYPAEKIFDTTSTSVSLIYKEILEGAFEGRLVNGATVKFTVYAQDRTDSTKVTGEDRVIYLNRYDYLSVESEGVPLEFALHENYPNPFNPTTTLRFDLPEASNITLTIFNMLGQKIRTYDMQSTPAGYHALKWNATNDYGDPVGAGVYLYQLQTKDFVKTRKMVLLK